MGKRATKTAERNLSWPLKLAVKDLASSKDQRREQQAARRKLQLKRRPEKEIGVEWFALVK